MIDSHNFLPSSRDHVRLLSPRFTVKSTDSPRLDMAFASSLGRSCEKSMSVFPWRSLRQNPTTAVSKALRVILLVLAVVVHVMSNFQSLPSLVASIVKV